MSHHNLVVPWVIALLTISSPALASNSNEDLFQMDLTELSELEVTIGSAAKAEKIIDTPVIATNYKASDLEAIGLRTLEDILDFIPGVIVQDTAIGTKAIMIRGIVEAFNQKVLFLLDGVPYWQPSHGDFPILGLPSEQIDHVEVIRGPGAVIYGTNASGGVINVITKQSGIDSTSVATGSNGYKQAQIHSTQDLNGLTVSAGASLQSDDGYDAEFENRPIPPIYPSDTPTATKLKKAENSKGVWFNFRGNNWLFGAHHSQQKTNGLAAAASTINESTLEYSGTLIHGNYEHQTSFGMGNFYADWNQFALSIPTDNLLGFGANGIQQFEDNGRQNTRARAGYKFDISLSENINWLNGIEFEQRTTGDYQNTTTNNTVATTSMVANDTDEGSLYTQIDATWDDYRFLLGARYVNNEKAGDHITPRIAVIKYLSQSQSLKALYSVGFNSPNFVQQYINIPPNIVKGDENLKAEKIQTSEIAYSIQEKQHFLVVNAFRLITEDFIFRDINENNEVVFANTNSYERTGIEIDYRYRQVGSDVYTNVSWIRQGNTNISNDITAKFTPKITANIGFSKNLNHQYRVGSSIRYLTERDTSDSITLLNFNASYQLQAWAVSITAENLLGVEPLHPDVQNFSSDTLVANGSKSPSYYGKLTYSF